MRLSRSVVLGLFLLAGRASAQEPAGEPWTLSLAAGAAGYSGSGLESGGRSGLWATLRLPLQASPLYAQATLHAGTAGLTVNPPARPPYTERLGVVALTAGAGVRQELAEDVSGFLEAGAGLLAGEDMDAGPALSVAGGAWYRIGANLSIGGQAGVLFADADLDRGGSLDGGWFLGAGLLVEF